jgi:hypothetical protein
MSPKVALILFLAIGVVVNFAPTYCAFDNRHPDRWSILFFNFLFGWTGIGWLLAIVWAHYKGKDDGSCGIFW